MKIPELQADFETGMGAILCPPDWFVYDPALRLMLLENWIYALERLYDATQVQKNTDDAIRKAMKK